MTALALLLLAATTPLEPVALDGHSVVDVDGTWQARLSDVGGASDEGTWQPIRVPGNFPFQGVHYDGIAWLRLRFTVPSADVDYALRVPMAANAYEVFVNGHRVGGRGLIGPDGALLEKNLHSQVYRLNKEDLHAGAPNTLALRLRTFYGNGGVMAPGVLLGPEEAVRDAHERGVARASLLVALFFFAAFFHLVLFLGRTRERHYLSFALLCFALASVTAGINTLGYLLTDSPDFNAYLVFVPLLVMPWWVLLFFADFFARRARVLMRAVAGGAVLGLVALVVSTVHHPAYPFFEGVVMPLSVLELVGALALAAWWTLVGLRERQMGARAIAVGVAAYGLTGSLELTWSFGLIDFHPDSYLGFTVFIGAMVTAIARRFSWLHSQVELGERDPLTGCLTRHGFLQRLKVMLDAHPQATCIMVDLDHFKRVNDTLGHQTGDRVLRVTGACVRGALRAADLVARWGGEEFLVLLPELDVGAGAHVAERIRAALEHESVDGISVTASFGVAGRTAGEDFDAWVARADQALYDAKHAGRNCVRATA